MLNWQRPFGGRRRTFAPEIKDSRTGPLIALTSAGRPRWTPRDYASLASEGFARNAVVYRCVRMVAEAAASTPLAVFVNGVRREDHPLARLLAQPNPEQSGTEWLETLYGGLQTAGNAYAEAVGDGEAEELWALRPDRVKVVPGRAGWPEAYEYAVDGRSLRIGRQADGWMPVMHLKLFHPADDHYGLSPLEAAQLAIETHNAAGRWNKALLDNAARPCGALVFEPGQGATLTQDQFDRLKAEMEAGFQGAANAGRPLLLEGGLKWQPLSLSPAELDFIEARNAAAREIALAFGVPPMLLGLPGDNTYANYSEANRALWRLTVLPLLGKIASSLSAYLGYWWEGLHLDISRNAIPALAVDRERLWRQVAAADFLSAEEKRHLLGLHQECDG